MARSCGITRPLHLMTHDDWGKVETEFDITLMMLSDNKVLLRHFLPLWMEWLSKDEDKDGDSPYLLPLTFSEWLNRSRWLKWPAVEVEAVRRVLLAWTHEVLADPNGKMFTHLLLEVEDDVAPYLDLWLDARPIEVAHWIVEYNWVRAEPAVLPWLVRPHVEEKLEDAFFTYSEGASATLLSRSIELVRSLRPVSM